MSITFYLNLLLCFNHVLMYSFEDLDTNKINLNDYLNSGPSDVPAIDLINGDIFLPYLFDTGVGNREVLAVNDITKNEFFPFGHDVLEWSAINFGSKQFLVGRRERSICLVQVKMKQYTTLEHNTLFFNETSANFEGLVGPIVLTKQLNYSSESEEGFAIVTESIEDFQVLHWLQITSKGLIPYDNWPDTFGGKIIHLKLISFSFNNFLLVVSQKMNGLMTIDISDYKYEERRLRISCSDNVILEYFISSVSTVVQGDNLYVMLVTPNEEKVFLYKFNLNIQKGTKFELLSHFYSPEVTRVDSFIQSGQHYFLINGKEPNIYILNWNGTLTSQFYDCGRVDEWLVLEVPTYREDVVLLAKNGSEVHIYTWGGSLKGFVLSDQPPCYLLDSSMKKAKDLTEGSQCLAECSFSKGAVLNVGHYPSLILTCRSNIFADTQIGGLYHFNVSLHPVYGPADDVIQAINRFKILNDTVLELSQQFEDEGLMEDVKISRRWLEKDLSEFDGNSLTQCLDHLDEKIDKLSLYLELKRQNNVTLSMSLHQGKLVGSANGLLHNEPVQMILKGKMRQQKTNSLYSDKMLIIDCDIEFGDYQHFLVKAELNLNNMEVVDVKSVQNLRSTDYSSHSVSPEVQGVPNKAINEEKLLHQRVSQFIHEDHR